MGMQSDRSAKDYDTPLTKEESLVCEALVREIGKAGRWSAVVDAWTALLHVRHMANAMHIEARMFQEQDGTRSDTVVPVSHTVPGSYTMVKKGEAK